MPTFGPQNAPRLAVMLSGGGRTLVNLAEHIRSGSLQAQITLVIASRECAGCDRARELGLSPLVMPGVIPAEELGRVLREHRADLVALAGYLKLVRVPRGFERRIINIHPALLPDFGGPGMHGRHVHEAVLKSGVKVSGCTVHYVDDRYDSGEIILQRVCPVVEGDTPDTLAARVFEQECIAYPDALGRVLAGRA